MGLWLKNQDGSISKAAGGGVDGKDGINGKDGAKGDPGLNGSDGAYLPLTGGTVTGDTTFDKSLFMDSNWIRISKNTGIHWSAYDTGLFSGDNQWIQTWKNSGILSSGGFAGGLHPTNTTSTSKDIRHDNTYGVFVAVSSSGKYKESIRPLTDAADTGEILDALRPVTYLAKANPGKAETKQETKFREANVEYGFIAEEVGAVDATTGSRLASYELNEEGNSFVPCSWLSGPMVSVLVAEVQQLRKRVSELEANNDV